MARPEHVVDGLEALLVEMSDTLGVMVWTALDETLRDGLQSASIVHPTIDDKIEILHLQNELGVGVSTIGIPRSSARVFEDCLRLCKEAAACRMQIRIACAGRTTDEDVMPLIEISQRAGVAVELYTFIGSSPIRQYIEGWDLAFIARQSARAIDLAVRAGLSVTYVTEDTTRSHPETLRELFKVAIGHGASRLCIADTVGHATPDGVANLLRFTKNVIAETGVAEIGIDWHGHDDRGLALSNALRAAACGADRIHATALGIGERAGNVPMELLLVDKHDRDTLRRYVETVARAVKWPLATDVPRGGRRKSSS